MIDLGVQLEPLPVSSDLHKFQYNISILLKQKGQSQAKS
jgi:hypothetical protein